MSWKMLPVAASIAAAATAVAFLYKLSEPSAVAFISPSDKNLVARGEVIYANNCAACHGTDLKGQPNWRDRLPNGRLPAPPHDETGHTWHHPDAVLVDIAQNGLIPGRTAPEGYQSDMPAFGKILSDDDVVAVLAYIKSTWPPGTLEAQKNVTLEQSRR